MYRIRFASQGWGDHHFLKKKTLIWTLHEVGLGTDAARECLQTNRFLAEIEKWWISSVPNLFRGCTLEDEHGTYKERNMIFQTSMTMFHVDLQGRSDITIHCVHWSTQMPHERNFYLHLGQIYSKCRDIFQTWSIWGIVVIVICFFLGYSILIFNTVAAYLERRFSPQWIDGYSTHMFQESVEWFGMTMYWRSAEKQIVALCQKVGFFHVFSQNPRNYLSHQIASKNVF